VVAPKGVLVDGEVIVAYQRQPKLPRPNLEKPNYSKGYPYEIE